MDNVITKVYKHKPSNLFLAQCSVAILLRHRFEWLHVAPTLCVAIKIVVANCSVLHNLKRSNPKGKIEFSKIGNLGDLCVTKIPLPTTRIVPWLNHVCYPGTYRSSVAYGVELS